MFNVLLHKKALKDVGSLDRFLWENVLREEVYALSVDFMKGKRLDGIFAGCRSKRVGEYRILYRVHFSEQKIEVIALKHRKEVYKRR